MIDQTINKNSALKYKVLENLLLSYVASIYIFFSVFGVFMSLQDSGAEISEISTVVLLVPLIVAAYSFIFAFPSLMLGYAISYLLIKQDIKSYRYWVLAAIAISLINCAFLSFIVYSEVVSFLAFSFLVCGTLCGFLMRRFSRGLLR